MVTKVNCPHCKKEVIWNSSAEFRPFCTERCRLQDLGAWFTEEHVIDGDENTNTESLEQIQNNSQNIN